MRFVAISAALLGAVFPLAAQADTGLYGSINLHGVSTSDVDTVIYAPDGTIFGSSVILDKVARQAAPAPANSDIIEGSWDLKPALGVSGSIGYDFGLIRAEAELAYSRSQVRTFNVTQLTGFGGDTTTVFADGDTDACLYLGLTSCTYTGNAVMMEDTHLRQLSGMANVWVDIPLEAPIEPYVGGGIGIMGLEVDGEGKSVFAWQVGAGLAYKINDSIAITADFRHRESDAIQLDFGGGEGVNFDKVKSNTYGLGLRVNF